MGYAKPLTGKLLCIQLRLNLNRSQSCLLAGYQSRTMSTLPHQTIRRWKEQGSVEQGGVKSQYLVSSREEVMADFFTTFLRKEPPCCYEQHGVCKRRMTRLAV